MSSKGFSSCVCLAILVSDGGLDRTGLKPRALIAASGAGALARCSRVSSLKGLFRGCARWRHGVAGLGRHLAQGPGAVAPPVTRDRGIGRETWMIDSTPVRAMRLGAGGGQAEGVSAAAAGCLRTFRKSRDRNATECPLAGLKPCRRPASRYDKSAPRFSARLRLVGIRRRLGREVLHGR